MPEPRFRPDRPRLPATFVPPEKWRSILMDISRKRRRPGVLRRGSSARRHPPAPRSRSSSLAWSLDGPGWPRNAEQPVPKPVRPAEVVVAPVACQPSGSGRSGLADKAVVQKTAGGRSRRSRSRDRLAGRLTGPVRPWTVLRPSGWSGSHARPPARLELASRPILAVWQVRQQRCRFSRSSVPPAASGTTWSTMSSGWA